MNENLKTNLKPGGLTHVNAGKGRRICVSKSRVRAFL